MRLGLEAERDIASRRIAAKEKRARLAAAGEELVAMTRSEIEVQVVMGNKELDGQNGNQEKEDEEQGKLRPPPVASSHAASRSAMQ